MSAAIVYRASSLRCNSSAFNQLWRLQPQLAAAILWLLHSAFQLRLYIYGTRLIQVVGEAGKGVDFMTFAYARTDISVTLLLMSHYNRETRLH